MAAFAAAPPRRRSLPRKNGPLVFICCIASLVCIYGAFVLSSFTKLRQKHQDTLRMPPTTHRNNDKNAVPHQPRKSNAVVKKLDNQNNSPACLFREYPKRRYYGLDGDSQPDFLQNAEYIYGKLPVMLQVDTSTQTKLCVNQTQWKDAPTKDGKLPFADGTNPSLLRLERLPSLDTPNIQGATFLATISMTNSLCSWKDTEQDKKDYHISQRTKPATIQSLLLWLDANFQTIHQTTILLERDAQWGGKRTPALKDNSGNYIRDIRALDDARLFVHSNRVWISYRDGPNFGYDKQVLNPLHLESLDTCIIKASESVPFCCGRNMALLENVQTKTLQSLTWVDPVTVIDVNVDATKTSRRRLILDTNTLDTKTDGTLLRPQHRRLGRNQQRESHFHGTNAFLVPYKEELLGIGHFHRPHDRGQNEYSRHGHHYTHAFFTISNSEPYYLKRLSAEFVFGSQQYPNDAAIIQFASGLELDQANKRAAIAYGINDCEGASVYVDLSVVEEMLQPVKQGQQVIDLMKKVES